MPWKLTFSALRWLARMIHPATRFSTENRSHLAGGKRSLAAPSKLRVNGSSGVMKGRPQLARGEGVQGAEASGEFGGVQVALAVQSAEKIVRWLFSFLGVAFHAAGLIR